MEKNSAGGGKKPLLPLVLLLFALLLLAAVTLLPRALNSREVLSPTPPPPSAAVRETSLPAPSPTLAPTPVPSAAPEKGVHRPTAPAPTPEEAFIPPDEPEPEEEPPEPGYEPEQESASPEDYMPHGDSELSAWLINDLVYTYAYLQEEGDEEVDQDLLELEEESPRLAELWQGIITAWRQANTEPLPETDTVPEGLPEDESLCIVVLGFQLKPDGGMEAELEGRCQLALRCAERYPQALIALTGGCTAMDNRHVSEARVMGDWLIAQGLEKSRIILEERSLTTGENADYLGDLLRREHPEVRSLLLVTSDYHTPLARLLFEEKALLLNYAYGQLPFRVEACAALDTRMRIPPDTGLQQRSYVWSLSEPD